MTRVQRGPVWGALRGVSRGPLCKGPREPSCGPAPLGRGAGAPAVRAAPEACARALCEHVRRKGLACLPWNDAIRQWRARVALLHDMEGSPWPDVSDASLARHLEDWFAGFTPGIGRWAHLARLDLAAVFDVALAEASHDRRELDRLAPVKMAVPSGSRSSE